MNIFKRIAIKTIFTKEQRTIIKDALCYSEYKYRQHGDIDNVIRVASVRKEVEEALKMKRCCKYTKQEVDEIINYFVDATIKAAIEVFNKKHKCKCPINVLEVGTIITRKKCDLCGHKDKCGIFSILFKQEDNIPDCGNENCEKQESCNQQDECPDYTVSTSQEEINDDEVKPNGEEIETTKVTEDTNVTDNKEPKVGE